MSTSRTVTGSNEHDTRLVIKRHQRSRWIGRLVVSLIGMGVAAAVAVTRLLPDQGTNPMITVLLGASVVGFGIATLLAWRRSGEFEILELRADRVVVRVSQSSVPVFDAPVTQTKLQVFTHPNPKVGLQVFLRDGVKAVEIARDLGQQQRQEMATRLAEILDTAKAGRKALKLKAA